MAEVVQVPILKLVTGPHKLRLELDSDALDELAASIRRIGIIVPLLVSPEGDSFVVIAGHRRLMAARMVGLQALPCCVREDSQAVGAEVSIAENLFRTDLTPIEQAAAIKDILDEKIMDVLEIAHVVHRSVHWVTAQLDMLSWPADVLEVIHNGKLSVSAGSNLALVNDESYRVFLVRNAVEQGATARTTAAWLQAWRAQMPPEAALEQPPVAGPQLVQPALPQAPCVCCSQMFRTDALAMVLICTACLNAVRGVGVQA